MRWRTWPSATTCQCVPPWPAELQRGTWTLPAVVKRNYNVNLTGVLPLRSKYEPSFAIWALHAAAGTCGKAGMLAFVGAGRARCGRAFGRGAEPGVSPARHCAG